MKLFGNEFGTVSDSLLLVGGRTPVVGRTATSAAAPCLTGRRDVLARPLYKRGGACYNRGMKRIYLLGSCNADCTIRAPYVPQAGETLKGSDFMLTAGGKGANQAYACANLGGDVHMAGCVGRDPFGDMLLKSLRDAGADVSHLRRSSRNTGVALIAVIDGDNRILLDEGANGEVTAADAEALLREARAGDIFMTQLEIPLPAAEAALRLAKARGLFTILNPAPAAEAACGCIKYVDLITPNETELAILSKKTGIEEGCRRLLEMGAGTVLATLGKDGSLCYGRDAAEKIAAVDAGKVVDTTAAGDTFCGALAVKLAEGRSVAEAARFASLCAGITVTRRGAQVSIPTRAEAEARARSLGLPL